ncbi:phosphatase PAP2 family protein [Oceanirhabdus sp. W0125-5]|uniref:phosphatase PAP2 family protein n=1 Tax=Oceanirhabdus sp. W0125-5 TaxID=2999116 RepID=UPI0022F308EA|nr:phosphatase PAP2 family protein [Oceanirhabdus sp. W0125-5]WBW99338.1 phosphatase PAP2 family protein [Oceanirhabdus sp. W0125-5]
MELIKFLQTLSNPVVDNIFIIITIFGEEIFYTLVLCIIFWCMDKKLGYKLGFSLFFSMTINGGLKELLNVKRPIGLEGINSLRVETATGMSFPSGHTQGTTTFWTSLMVNLKKRWLYLFGTLIIILVGISRLYLGVHWPSDVIGAIIIGIVCVFISNIIIEFTLKKGNYVPLIVIAIISVLGLLFFNSSDYVKIVGIMNGFIIGMILEQNLINFNVKGTLKQNILKVLFGLSIVLAIKILFKIILPAGNLGDLFRYGLIGLWVIAGAPYCFKKYIK